LECDTHKNRVTNRVKITWAKYVSWGVRQPRAGNCAK
jgi:hypothetical protein